MKLVNVTVSSAMVLLSSCATQENVCEDITIANEQLQQCQVLQKQIAKAKDRPIIRTELERRYQTDCVDVRYYRDEHQEAICGNKQQLEQLKQKGDNSSDQ
ncbi:hypothetical protein [Thalassotalea sp. G2M2-11]|uniref:hypothetical protein n=1 Tax=Thalassotalea sp. G2M2-11 TaxID=2787627 RepID=UPI0019CFF899|nr:hypothetical protein [Thalassotalea sp. G2M2-11]